MSVMSQIQAEGIFLRADLQEFITETFAKRYDVNLENWIEPYAYWDQFNQSILSTRESVPDGTYVLFGKVIYPGDERMSYYHIYQFNVLKLRGADVQIASGFNDYPNPPARVPIRPIFPIFKVDQCRSYEAAKRALKSRLSKPMHVRELENLIKESNTNSLENKLYRLRLALQVDIDKYKK